ncbi:MAG TPA: hypothetical protein ENJ56_09240, partial [Anaerolineae bacterium]|nr:hypothetical protein [Anaerolineae bacterium]
MTRSLQQILLASSLAIILVVAIVLASTRLVRGDSSLLRNVSLSETTLSPNADGENDVLSIAYEISRVAQVSIYFENASGNRFYFRDSKTRGTGKYKVLFSGIVDGYTLPDEQLDNEVEARLLQNGDYTWIIEAVDKDGVTEQQTGNLQISEADADLPLIIGFEQDRDIFTPNRDGIDDRVKIQFDLKKDAEKLRVFLVDAEGVEREIQALPGARPPRTADDPADEPNFVAGRHVYDYEGGVDLNATPPDDGTYEIVAVAEDAEGQRVRTGSSLTIELGGVPRAEIPAPVSGDTIQFSLSGEDA